MFWVDARTQTRFEISYRSIAGQLGLPNRNDPNTDILQLVKNWLCDEVNGPWIMVLDGAEDVNVFYPTWNREAGLELHQSNYSSRSLEAYLPIDHGSILATSQSQNAALRLVGSSKYVKEVPLMDESHAIQLIRNKPRDASDISSLIPLVRALDHIPLVISQVAAHINLRSPNTTVSSYLDGFSKNDSNRIELLRMNTSDNRWYAASSNSVMTTWQMTFEKIRHERRSVANLLSFMCFFKPRNIP